MSKLNVNLNDLELNEVEVLELMNKYSLTTIIEPQSIEDASMMLQSILAKYPETITNASDDVQSILRNAGKLDDFITPNNALSCYYHLCDNYGELINDNYVNVCKCIDNCNLHQAIVDNIGSNEALGYYPDTKICDYVYDNFEFDAIANYYDYSTIRDYLERNGEGLDLGDIYTDYLLDEIKNRCTIDWK